MKVIALIPKVNDDINSIIAGFVEYGTKFAKALKERINETIEKHPHITVADVVESILIYKKT